MPKDYNLTNLHSNMVRFIIKKAQPQVFPSQAHLHSNMVRFIIKLNIIDKTGDIEFTFQYG